GRLRDAGLVERRPEAADVIVVNTCSVTAEADRAARAFIRRARRENPRARILATGCYAQRAPTELASLPGVAAVIGNSHKALAPQVALELAGFDRPVPMPLVTIPSILAGSSGPLVLADDRFAHSFLEEARLQPGAQTRPNLKIQEGCGNRCSFCVIPQTRGSSRSLPAAAVLSQVKAFVAAGGNELVISGINLGRWGHDLDAMPGEPRPRLAALIRGILVGTALPRLRLSSIEPMDWDDELITLMSQFGASRLARHAHLPLQSGSDAVLRRMHRRYRPWHYGEKAAALLRAAGPHLTLGADVMIGFPGETDREFEETLDFIRELPFGYLHLFPFSPRPGTRAWKLHEETPVPCDVVSERMAALRRLAAEKSQAHRERMVGVHLDAITLRTPAGLATVGRTSALTENFIPVEIEASLPANRLVRICPTGLNSEGFLVAAEAVAAAVHAAVPPVL
ncbi:MAG TPA: MiaB/RimO family radical SAM methylthiotransferase, partial [Terracidiphilus sp.]|nr:MiaB/RimO family radical SAM methylthiotransferase [Terracidiphilus sp.]